VPKQVRLRLLRVVCQCGATHGAGRAQDRGDAAMDLGVADHGFEDVGAP
jgi:hypothetical protein